MTKKIISFILAFSMLLSLCACESGSKNKEPIDAKAILTNPEADYSAAALEALKSGEHRVDEYDLPALYKYFEGRCKIGVAFGANQAPDAESVINNTLVDDAGVITAKGMLKHYNMYTLGNEMKPAYINSAEGTFNFDDADNFVAFGKAAKAELRGHTLLWHSQIPDWWFKADASDTRTLQECDEAGALASSEQLQDRITKYITEVVTRYKDDIKIWDVCNEVLNGESIRRKADDSYWADIIGDLDGNGFYDDYVEIAVNAARAADEDAILIINDFNMEWQTSKTQAMYDMVERMLRKGVRIDGVGFQSHISVDCNVGLYKQNIEKIAGLAAVYDECFPEHKGNFRIQITELDMNMFVGADADGGFKKWSAEDFERQAAKYRELMDMFLEFVDDGYIDAIVFWGTDDENSWLNSTPKLRRNAALLVNRDSWTLKPAFYAVAESSFGPAE